MNRKLAYTALICLVCGVALGANLDWAKPAQLGELDGMERTFVGLGAQTNSDGLRVISDGIALQLEKDSSGHWHATLMVQEGRYWLPTAVVGTMELNRGPGAMPGDRS